MLEKGSEEYNKANEKSSNEKLKEKIEEDLVSKAEKSITSTNSFSLVTLLVNSI